MSPASAGDRAGAASVAGDGVLAVRIPDLAALYEPLDPAPRRERDLEFRAHEFLVEWAEDFGRDAPLSLTVHVRKWPVEPDEVRVAREAVRHHFEAMALQERRRFRALMRQGRLSLVIGVAFLTACLAAVNAIGAFMPTAAGTGALREILLIGGWVAMWQPLQIYLYEWWPLRRRERLFRRMAAMPVNFEPGTSAP